MKYPSGVIYEGGWKEDLFEGEGILRDKDG